MKKLAGLPEIPNWPKTLRDEFAIARYIDEHSPGIIDADEIEETYSGYVGVLTYVNPKSLKQNNADGNVKSVKKQKAYAELPWETRPPIVTEDEKVIDGNHRVRCAIAKGEPRILTYNVFER